MSIARRAHPLPLLNGVRVGLPDELAHSAQGVPAPSPKRGDFSEMRCDADWPGLSIDLFMFCSWKFQMVSSASKYPLYRRELSRFYVFYFQKYAS